MVLHFSPWRHESELAMVRDWFFAGHVKHDDGFSDPMPDMRQRAVDRVNLWLFKAGHLPPALIATAGLTEALLHDEASRTERGISDLAMQSIYAMAFARFVNGFVDRDVARSQAAELALDGADVDNVAAATSTAKGESSMYAHAATIGMPPKFVDLRHEVTHGHIPSLIYLKRMTLQALEWLWDRWWLKNATGDPSRALRELEERTWLCRQAREADESRALVAQGAATVGMSTSDQVYDAMAVDESNGSHGIVEDNPSRPSIKGGKPSRKRKQAA
ncbi:hypothetical protein A1O1_08894 [Capronia coronata CBS 617.96]|uniref:Uncharacterized protein n=1 Tax=Capronia coronata CBS 617.96 TaxID=1182541 RepID=W9XE75_9EURO|nr:uncharacterized protein A1O1_08894 [Capronia coronata CBS 617.96]EXJ78493.1 hypothetical protein A1O1_08894 [Capronia coronata CBS 617.96]